MTGQTDNNVAQVEYTGTYPGAQPHGNSKYKNAAEYQRSRPEAGRPRLVLNTKNHLIYRKPLFKHQKPPYIWAISHKGCI